MKNIKRIRINCDYTQRRIFIDTGIPQSTQSKYELGDAVPTTKNLLILADYYGTSIDYLLDRTDEPAPYPKK